MVSETACKTVFLVVTAFGLDGVGWEVVDVAVVAALVLDVLGEGVLDVVAVDGLVFGRVADRWQSCLFDFGGPPLRLLSTSWGRSRCRELKAHARTFVLDVLRVSGAD